MVLWAVTNLFLWMNPQFTITIINNIISITMHNLHHSSYNIVQIAIMPLQPNSNSFKRKPHENRVIQWPQRPHQRPPRPPPRLWPPWWPVRALREAIEEWPPRLMYRNGQSRGWLRWKIMSISIIITLPVIVSNITKVVRVGELWLQIILAHRRLPVRNLFRILSNIL